VFGERKEISKLHMIVHILEEGIEIVEIAYDSPRLWRRERSS